MAKYVYDSEKFCVPVTKAEPLESIRFIIEDFKKKKVTFCIDGEGEAWEIWRLVEEDDNDKIKKKGAPAHPAYLYVDGEEVTDYDIA